MAFLDKKFKTYFKRMDYDHDGVITRKDFEGMAERFIAKGELTGDKAKALHKSIETTWDKYLSDLANKDQITEKDFVKNLKKVVEDEKHHNDLLGPLPLFFKCIDRNEDDQIDMGEYVIFFEILGIENAAVLAEPSFKAIDTNADGYLSVDEFTQAGKDFFTNATDESTPTKFFFGPLVE